MSSCNKKELEFCVFLINAIADNLGLLTPTVYKKLNDSRILDEYIIPFYDVLHTLGEEYLLHDIIDMMKERRVLE